MRQPWLVIAGKEAPTEAEMQRVRDARQGMAWALALLETWGASEPLLGGAMTDLHMRAHAPSRPNVSAAQRPSARIST